MADRNENRSEQDDMFAFDKEEGLGDKSPEHVSPKISPRDKKPKQQETDRQSDNVPLNPFMVAATPPKFVSFEDIMKAANGVSNMSLAHEIAVDNDFRFSKPEMAANSLEKQVADVMRKAFWDVLQEQLNESPPDYRHALKLLEEIKLTLLESFVTRNRKMQEELEEVLDLELIKQKAENEALDIHYYADYITGLMAKLCSPQRDEKIAQIREIKEVVPLFKNILEMLDVMKMDMANFTIQQIRPYIQQHSVEYERTKFQEFLKQSEENNVDGLQFTRSWLERNGLTLYYKNQENPGPSGGPNTSLFTPLNIMNTAYLELLDWPENQIFPETVVMDVKRFKDLETKLKFLTLISSILLVTYNTVGGAIAGIADLKSKLKDQITVILKDVPESGLKEAMKHVSAQVDKEVCECLVKHGFPTLDQGRKTMLEGQVQEVLQPEHPVHKIMKSRVTQFLRSLISTSGSANVQIPTGFSAVTEELKHISGQFVRLVSHNRQVFGMYYADIISAVLKKCEELASEEGTPV